MEGFVLSRQSCECCLAHCQHHKLPTGSRRQVLGLKNCHFPASLVMTELYCKLPFPPGPVRNPGLRPALGPLHAQGQPWSTPGGDMGGITASCLCSQLFLVSSFLQKSFLPGDGTVEHKSNFGGTVVGDYAQEPEI